MKRINTLLLGSLLALSSTDGQAKIFECQTKIHIPCLDKNNQEITLKDPHATRVNYKWKGIGCQPCIEGKDGCGFSLQKAFRNCAFAGGYLDPKALKSDQNLWAYAKKIASISFKTLEVSDEALKIGSELLGEQKDTDGDLTRNARQALERAEETRKLTQKIYKGTEKLYQKGKDIKEGN